MNAISSSKNTLFSLHSLRVVQSILVHEILTYVEKSDGSALVHGVGLCVALFISEFSKAFFASLLWAVNLRTAIRMKGAFSMLAFQKIITLRTLSDVTVGEVASDWLIRSTALSFDPTEIFSRLFVVSRTWRYDSIISISRYIISQYIGFLRYSDLFLINSLKILTNVLPGISEWFFHFYFNFFHYSVLSECPDSSRKTTTMIFYYKNTYITYLPLTCAKY